MAEHSLLPHPTPYTVRSSPFWFDVLDADRQTVARDIGRREDADLFANAPETARRLEELALAADDILAELSDGLRAVSVVERSAAAGRLRAALKRARGGA